MFNDTGVETRGFGSLQNMLDNLPAAIDGAVEETESYAVSLILADQGGGHPFYPPETASNAPPAPYYARYRGSIDSAGNVTQFSEQMGERFEHEIQNSREIHIRNTASYAQEVIGFMQRPLFAAIGWLQLRTAAENNIGGITAWLGKTLMQVWGRMGTDSGAWDD